MITLLPVVILFAVVLIVIAMPWRKPHPNHVFMFELVEFLASSPEGKAADFTADSRSCNEPLTIGKYKFSRGGF